jgi:phage shock protein C
MTQRTWNIDYGPLRGLYRDSESGWIFGVCAGLADRFNFRLGTIRVIALICLVLFFWMTVALYIAATLIIRDKPLIYSGNNSEFEFWRRTRRDHWSRP